ncbi:MAG: hypothetical protein EA424_26795, partial [Planctomycetaceae bacterium]
MWPTIRHHEISRSNHPGSAAVGQLVPLDQPRSCRDVSQDLPICPRWNNSSAIRSNSGGSALVSALDGDPDRLLLLDADSPAEDIAWEFAATDGRQLLAARYGLLRLVDRPAPPVPPGILRFIALAADPLVDARGEPREDHRLDSDTELRAVRRVLADSRRAIRAQRAAPTRVALRRLLVGGPALLHLTCHGNVSDTP